MNHAAKLHTAFVPPLRVDSTTRRYVYAVMSVSAGMSQKRGKYTPSQISCVDTVLLVVGCDHGDCESSMHSQLMYTAKTYPDEEWTTATALDKTSSNLPSRRLQKTRRTWTRLSRRAQYTKVQSSHIGQVRRNQKIFRAVGCNSEFHTTTCNHQQQKQQEKLEAWVNVE